MKILQGDVLEKLKEIPSESVQCCVTSPPYWGLRNYGHESQIGLEKTPEEYTAKITEVFREVRRVLRENGTLWLNLGDSYCSQGDKHEGRADKSRVWRYGSGRADGIVDKRGQRNRNGNIVVGLKPKDLVGIPWRVAFALQTDGWYLRQDIIWAKPNPMPESVTDRCTKAHEYIFLLTKSAKYFYDAEAIKEPATELKRLESGPVKFGGNKAAGYGTRIHSGKNWTPNQGGGTSFNGHSGNFKANGELINPGGNRNKRSVWTITTQPYSEAHFATFPEQIPKLCVLAGSKPGDTILDPFAGSGTVGKVAIELGRNPILIELNPEYIKLIEKRCTTTIGMF